MNTWKITFRPFIRSTLSVFSVNQFAPLLFFLSPSVLLSHVITLCLGPVQSQVRRCTVNAGQVMLLNNV